MSSECDEAARLLRQAEKATDPAERKRLVKLAREWRYLADTRSTAPPPARPTGFARSVAIARGE